MKAIPTILLALTLLGSASVLACPTNPKAVTQDTLTSTQDQRRNASRAADALRQIADSTPATTVVK